MGGSNAIRLKEGGVGSVSPETMGQPTVFISYSHVDSAWKDQLVKHLKVLGMELDFETWNDERIAVGGLWYQEIGAAMDRAQVAVLLVSVDFLNSRFIRETEVPRLLERRAQDGMRVYPIIVRACPWPRVGWLGSIQARLFDGEPLSALCGNKLEAALVSIAEDIWSGLEGGSLRTRGERFLATYRECLKPKWSRWDLSPVGVTQTGGAGAPIEPLPNKRHLLYEACIENLLTAPPAREPEEGALLRHKQWRPDDSEERMRVVAALAHGVQSEDKSAGDAMDASVREWGEMAEFLPDKWANKMEFIAWLAGSARLLTERTGGLAFTHASFQEFLTAWHLNATLEGTERIKEFGLRLQNDNWWETLRLWAALIERQNPSWLDRVLEALSTRMDGISGISLVGAILADGLGSETRFNDWIEEFLNELASDWPENSERCCQAWKDSHQENRKQQMVLALRSHAPQALWPGWLRLEEFCQKVDIEVILPHPESRLSRGLVSQKNQRSADTSTEIAVGRILGWPPPSSKSTVFDGGLLQVWPSYRVWVGNKLQLAVSCGANEADVRKLFAVLASEATEEEMARNLARDVAPYLARDLASHMPTRDARLWARGLARYWTPYWARGLARDGASDLARRWDRKRVRDLARRLACDLAERMKIETAHWIFDFAAYNMALIGTASARAQIAGVKEYKSPQLKLLSKACELSFKAAGEPAELKKALFQLAASLDPLWPALARHLARHSTEEDRTLLTDLAQHPEHCESRLLSWEFQYIVRGDIMREDGSVVTLDNLSEETGAPRLPYLEEMPDELEVDWNR